MDSPAQRRQRSKIAFLNRSYWPDAEATGQLLSDLTTELASRWDVSVVVGQPNRNPEQVSFQRLGVERRDGVSIHRLGHLQMPKRFPAGRMLNLLSFSRNAARHLKRQGQVPDLVVAETDPFLLPIVAARYARRSGCKFIAYLQDIYPDIAVALGKAKEGFIVDRIRSSLLKAYQQADRVVVLDEDMRRRLASWGVAREKLVVVPNWVDTSKLVPIKQNNPFRQSHSLCSRFVVMHSGNMGLSQRLSVLLEALLQPNVDPTVVGVLVGDGADRPSLTQWVKRRAAEERVRFFDYQPRVSLSVSLSAADLHVISMDAAITGCLAPSKLYGILASATPILAIVPPESEVWRLVVAERLGWVAPPDDVNAIARAIEEARIADAVQRREMGDRGRRIAIERFDAKSCIQQFENVLRDVCDE